MEAEPGRRATLERLVDAAVHAHARRDHRAAHELFEEAWVASGTPRSLELHALAQLEAGLHKRFVEGKDPAARNILARARAKLERVPTSAFGLDLAVLRRDLDAAPPAGDVPPPRLIR